MTQSFEQRPVFRLAEEQENRFSELRPDFVHFLQLLSSCTFQPFDRAEMRRQDLRRPLTDMSNTNAKQQPPEFERSAGIDLFQEVFSRFRPYALEFFQLILL